MNTKPNTDARRREAYAFRDTLREIEKGYDGDILAYFLDPKRPTPPPRYTIIARWDGAYWTSVFECLSNNGAEILNAAWSHFCAENELRPEEDEGAESNRQNFEPIVIFRGEIPMGRDQIYWGDTGIVEHVEASIPQVMKGVGA